MADSYKLKLAQSALSAENLLYIENKYLSYVHEDLDNELWQTFFNDYIEDASVDSTYKSAEQIATEYALTQSSLDVSSGPSYALNTHQLIQDYRRYGHYYCNCGYFKSPDISKSLNLADYNLSLDLALQPSVEFAGCQYDNMRSLQTALSDIYCGSIGYEYSHIDNEQERTWLQHRIEKYADKPASEDRIAALSELVRSEVFEQYLGRKFVGQKRFSLEGGEAFIPLLERLLLRSSENGVDDVVIGMAHRGRLNVLMNVMGMPSSQIEEKFHGSRNDLGISGDVKYHLGYSANRTFSGRDVHVTLSFNPSHLEVIAPVVMGSVRARLDKNTSLHKNSCAAMAILVHGDASIAGQGVVSESLNMAYTKANYIGGSMHVVINNQIGFTTDPVDSRSSTYCTDIAKLIQAPVFHVYADDVDAVIKVVDLACDYKVKFQKDVFIDLVCYRRHGHNESDEPAAMHPLMYKEIRKHPGVASIYAAKLAGEGIINQDYLEEAREKVVQLIKKGEALVAVHAKNDSWRQRDWRDYQEENWFCSVVTAVDKDKLMKVGEALLALPEGFTLQKQVQHMHDARLKMVASEVPLNWGCAEMLAYASLLAEGYDIRIVGQDSCRGTFAHRHAVYVDNNNGEKWCPLQECSLIDGSFSIYNSVLSENASLAFEYGYSEASPKTLVIWEAQFGDFANNAQVVIDQFLASAWQKWQRMSGLILLLPHGYEGQGPEHSSARPERFLQLCAQENIQVCVPTTPAQYFHLIRRQLLRPYRRPLVVMSPKSLLRRPDAVSELSCLNEGHFEVIIPDQSATDAKKCKRLIICSGKVYYELCALRDSEKLDNVHIVRLEQVYPFPDKQVSKLFADYAHLSTLIWCQEEPHNQGGWYTIYHRLEQCTADNQRVCYAGRPKMAAPAAGDFTQFKQAQKLLLEQALGMVPNTGGEL